MAARRNEIPECFTTIDPQCQLDLWAKVVKAKNIQLNEWVFYDLDAYGNKIPKEIVLTPPTECGGPTNPVTCIEDIKIRNLEVTNQIVCNSKVVVGISADMIIVAYTADECYFIQVVPFTFEKTIPRDEFVPPITADELEHEVDQSEEVIKNWRFDYDINGFARDAYGNVTGTLVKMSAYADVITKLAKWQDVLVYGVVDPIDG